jgi:hypothetical protein
VSRPKRRLSRSTVRISMTRRESSALSAPVRADLVTTFYTYPEPTPISESSGILASRGAAALRRRSNDGMVFRCFAYGVDTNFWSEKDIGGRLCAWLDRTFTADPTSAGMLPEVAEDLLSDLDILIRSGVAQGPRNRRTNCRPFRYCAENCRAPLTAPATQWSPVGSLTPPRSRAS